MNNMLIKFYVKFQDLVTREEGQDLVEYALVAALVSLGAITILGSVGTSIINIFTKINSALA